MKKILNKLFSMKFALVILGLLIIACILGSVITQGLTETQYLQSYSETIVHLILFLGLDDVFVAPWFLVLTVFLCISLLGCNLLRFPNIMKQMKCYGKDNFIKDEPAGNTEMDIDRIFYDMGYRKTEKEESKIYAKKNTIGIWGAWLTHLGIFIIIIGFAYGQISTVDYTAYGIEGDTVSVEGTDLSVTIDSFHIGLREDETVEQYTSQITVTDFKGNTESGTTSVNHPCETLGYKVYQNSTGWAAHINLYEDNRQVATELLYPGEYVEVQQIPGLVIQLRAFYPDYVNTEDGPATASSNLNNPGYLYIAYYNNSVIGMNVLVDDYISFTDSNLTVDFSDPVQYTLLQFRKDNSTGIVLVGAIIILLALFIAFYFPTSEMLAEKDGDRWTIYLKSRKNDILLKEKLHSLINKEEE